jgi:hypothetical protein
MEWNDRPAGEPAQPSPAEPAIIAPPAAAPVFGGIRRTIATAVLAVGLLIVGGTAVAFAADPSASPAPNASSGPANGGGTTRPSHVPGSTANCPNMGGNGSGGAGGSTTPSTTGPTSSPAL